MTSFVLAFDLLFLVLVATSPIKSSSSSSSSSSSKSQTGASQNDLVQLRTRWLGAREPALVERERPPDPPPSSSDKSQLTLTTTTRPKNEQAKQKVHHHHHQDQLERVIYSKEEYKKEEDAKLGRAIAKGRFKRTSSNDRAELALVASSSGLSNGQLDQSTAREQTSDQALAELCYLADGSSSLTLAVNEATPVGSVIGTIEVTGDPELEGGNIDLLDGLDPATEAALSLQSFPGAPSAFTRQNRRLFGRREAATTTATTLVSTPNQRHQAPPPPPSNSTITTTQRPSAAGEPVAEALTSTSAFYSLVAASSPSSSYGQHPAATPTQQQQQQTNLAPAVRLQPGTKKLVLARALDKESAEGETSQLVNVRCRPRAVAGRRHEPLGSNRQQLSKQQTTFTTIPIRLIITDANDHAPEFLGPLPYVINVSETLPVGSVLSRDILARDRDSAGPHSTIHYRVLDSSELPDSQAAPSARGLSSWFTFANPLEPTLTLAQPLDYESLPSGPTFTFLIAAQDQAEPEPLQSIAQVQVNVLDFDDQNPRFPDEKYTVLMDETQASLVGQNLRVLPRNLRAEDGDRGIQAAILYSFDGLTNGNNNNQQVDFNDEPGGKLATSTAKSQDPAQNIEQFLHLNPNSGELRLIRQWPLSSSGLPLTLVVRATQADNRDRYALTTLTIVRSDSGALPAGASGKAAVQQQQQQQALNSGGKRGIEFLQERLVVEVPEDTPVNEKIARVKAHHLQESWQQHKQQESNDALASSGDLDGAQSTATPTSGNKTTNKRPLTFHTIGQQAAPTNASHIGLRPINYQLLDDQTDQFGINGLGELFLRRPLDYEQRQEFRIRVLATYTKHSDICHVQVLVVNVNDNKPKFTQAQYSFHLTESRFRSNLAANAIPIGIVQAHDADLNDTLHYAIVPTAAAAADHQEPAQLCGRLFDISSTTGQLSLRLPPSGSSQTMSKLNVSSCQLVVQAGDSLGPLEKRHRQQARAYIYVAPQLVGRTLVGFRPQNQMQDQNEHQPSEPVRTSQENDDEAKLFNARSLHGDSSSVSAGANWPPSTSPTHHGRRDQHQRHNKQLVAVEHQLAESSTVSSSTDLLQIYNQQPSLSPSGTVQPSSQRSSMATVVASLQHMMKSVNFLEMPMPSALLLSVLLAFLVCLLLIIVISMTVHVYRRQAIKSSQRQHLPPGPGGAHGHLTAAAARLRHAHMAAASRSSASTTGGVGRGSSSPYGSSSTASSSAPACSISSPVTGRQQQRHQQRRRSPYYDNLAVNSSGAGTKTTSNERATEAANSSPTSSTSVAASNESPPDGRSSPTSSSATSRASPNKQAGRPCKQFEALEISVATERDLAGQAAARMQGGSETYLRSIGQSKQNPLYLETPTSNNKQVPSNQLLNSNSSSSSTLGSKQSHQFIIKSPLSSYRSTASTNDSNSSAPNCGHYSVNGTMETVHKTGAKGLKSSSSKSRPSTLKSTADQNKSDTLESAISKLVREHEEGADKDEVEDELNANKPRGLRQVGAKAANVKSCSSSSANRRDQDELVQLTQSKPGVKSYRRLPLMNSLIRPVKTQLLGGGASSTGNRVAPIEQLLNSHQQRIEQAAQVAAAHNQQQQQQQAGLMALVRGQTSAAVSRERPNQIKWPSESIPQRIKKLTWDDELSCSGLCGDDGESLSFEQHPNNQNQVNNNNNNNELLSLQISQVNDNTQEDDDECYISPHLRLGAGGEMSPSGSGLERELHLYGGADPNQQELRQNQFLFSLSSSHMLPSLGVMSQQQQQSMAAVGASASASASEVAAPRLANGQQAANTKQRLLDEVDAHTNCRNQNNCLDYTIVDSSQFHVESLASVSGRSGGAALINDYFARSSVFSAAARQHQADAQQRRLNPFQLTVAEGDQQDQEHSLASSGHHAQVTFKLNQNYQDLKLMTTAVL